MDAKYIKRVLNGEIEAYAYLVRQYQATALRTAMAIVKNEADAKDVVQDSFIQAYESLSKYRGEAKFSSWICRIVINNSLKFTQKNKPQRPEKIELLINDPIVYNQGLLALNKEDLENLIKKGLNLLAPKEALCVQLFYLEEYRLKEIIQLTGFSKSNVKVLLHRGRKNLYRHLLRSYKAMKK